jgi:hypothetical protein
MGIVSSILGGTIGRFYGPYAYWAVKLDNGKFQSEIDSVFDVAHAGKRPFDWTLDLVATDDILRVQELWLFCPPNSFNPLGSTARLPILIPGTAFQFKVANMDSNFATATRNVASQVIGRVDDPATGACTFFVYDGPQNVMSFPLHTNIYNFGSWRDGIAPIKQLSFEVLGLRL